MDAVRRRRSGIRPAVRASFSSRHSPTNIRRYSKSNLADLAEGGTAHNPTYNCGAPGMPRMMIVYEAMEIVITPQITYLMQEYMNPLRRIYTDGRPWPGALESTSAGYSIGNWLDQDGDGRFDTLLIETRGIKGDRVFDGSGIPLHKDNQTVVKERIALDQQNPNLLHDEITTIDHALTRPWTVTRSYARTRNPTWFEYNCVEDNRYVQIGPETYVISRRAVCCRPAPTSPHRT